MRFFLTGGGMKIVSKDEASAIVADVCSMDRDGRLRLFDFRPHGLGICAAIAHPGQLFLEWCDTLEVLGQ